MATGTDVAADQRLRIDDLAQLSGVASGTIRFYQREGLIPPPTKEGRIAYYGTNHLRALARVRELQAKRIPLGLIKDLIDGEESGLDMSAYQSLGRVLFEPRAEDENLATATIPEKTLLEAGMAREDLDSLLSTGLGTRAEDGAVTVDSAALEIFAGLIQLGVKPQFVAQVAELIGQHLRAIVAAMTKLGWEALEDDLGKIDDPQVAEELAKKLDRLKSLSERSVARVFRHLLDEAVREEVEPVAVARAERVIAERRRAMDAA
jgi:DNA-binding transcriptional MerR regulator